MPKIGINDLSTELAAMICNKFTIEKSIYTTTKKEISIPIGIEGFNKGLDELIVVKNSIVLNSSDYVIDDRSESILPVNDTVWDASVQYPVEYNFIVLKSAMPRVSAKLWRNSYTLKSNEKAVPITVESFNAATDQLIVVKNGTVVAHDEYEIVENTVKAATESGLWEATKKSPVVFDFIVFKYATPKNGIALNGYHLLPNSVSLEALHPDLKAMVTRFESAIAKIDFLFDAINKYGNYELKSYITANFNDPNSEILKKIEKGNKAFDTLLKEYENVKIVSKARHDEILAQLVALKRLKDLDKLIEDMEKDKI